VFQPRRPSYLPRRRVSGCMDSSQQPDHSEAETAPVVRGRRTADYDDRDDRAADRETFLLKARDAYQRDATEFRDEASVTADEDRKARWIALAEEAEGKAARYTEAAAGARGNLKDLPSAAAQVPGTTGKPDAQAARPSADPENQRLSVGRPRTTVASRLEFPASPLSGLTPSAGALQRSAAGRAGHVRPAPRPRGPGRSA
jgi:hypothetical protein